MNSVLSEVREKTRGAHERLERRLTVFGTGFSRDAYARYLDRFLGLLTPAESQAHASRAFKHALPDLETRTKTAFLARDLAALQTPYSGLSAPLPAMHTVPEFFGTYYVLEGATLGGAVLARRVEAELGAGYCQYFRCYGAELGPRWRVFCAALEAHGGAPHDAAAMVTRALGTFELVETWLEAGGLLA